MKYYGQLIYALGMLVIWVFCISLMILVTTLLDMWGIVLPLIGLYIVTFIMEGIRNLGDDD